MADSTSSPTPGVQAPLEAAMRSDQPFRSMDLPVELRLMVYERLPREIEHHVIRLTPTEGPDEGPPLMTLAKKAVPTAILATCKEVHAETNMIVQRTIESFILNSSPKLFLALPEKLWESRGLGLFSYYLSVLGSLLRKLATARGVIRTLTPYPWARFVDLLSEKTEGKLTYNMLVQTVLQIAYAHSRGSLSSFQLFHVMIQPDTGTRREARISQIKVHNVRGAHDLDPRYVRSSSPGWVEVTLELWDDALSNRVLPVSEWPLYRNDGVVAQYQHNLEDGSKVAAAIDEDTWKEGWLE